MTGTYHPVEPEICACRMNMEETRWHCPGCARWKPSRQEYCGHCAPVLPLVDDDVYFDVEQTG